MDFVSDEVLGGNLGGISLVDKEKEVRYCREFIYRKRAAMNSTNIIVAVLYIDLGSGEAFFVV